MWWGFFVVFCFLFVDFVLVLVGWFGFFGGVWFFVLFCFYDTSLFIFLSTLVSRMYMEIILVVVSLTTIFFECALVLAMQIR